MTDQHELTFQGYASIFNVADDVCDIVAPGAFARSLAQHRPTRFPLLWQHNPQQPIGLWHQIYEDHHGLFVLGRLLGGISLAREAGALILGGALDGLSIGFRTRRARKDRNAGTRIIEEIDLWEISLVTFPQNPLARISRITNQPKIPA